MLPSSDIQTAYPKSLDYLRSLVADMSLDVTGLSRCLQRCDLSACGGTCCHDGVYLSQEEAEGIRSLVAARREWFEARLTELPRLVVEYGSWKGFSAGPKTATRPSHQRETLVGYPEHFPETACVFLQSGARCALQTLAMEEGRHPWYYKPATCWMHPLSLKDGGRGVKELTVYGREDDPQQFEDYPGFASYTPCGKSCGSGRPAYKVLGEELDYLSRLSQRDLVGEMEAERNGKAEATVVDPAE